MSDDEVMFPTDEEFARMGDRLMEAVDDYESSQAMTRVAHRPRTRRRLRIPALLTAVAAVALVIGIAVPSPWVATAPASASTPVPLRYVLAESDPREVITQAQERLHHASIVQEVKREVRSLGWHINIDGDGIPSLMSEPMAPVYRELTWYEDFSAVSRTVAVELIEADQTTVGDNSVSIQESTTTVVEQRADPAGSFYVPILAPAGDSAEDMRAVLRELGLPNDHEVDAGEVIVRLAGAMELWTFTDAQHIALLEILAASSGLNVAGETTDRLGRPVIGLSASRMSQAAVEQTVLISRESGRILGIEMTYRQGVGDIPAGTVGSYALWEVEAS